jgi:hypothetical protein
MGWWQRLTNTFRRRRLDREIDDELQSTSSRHRCTLSIAASSRPSRRGRSSAASERPRRFR